MLVTMMEMQTEQTPSTTPSHLARLALSFSSHQPSFASLLSTFCYPHDLLSCAILFPEHAFLTWMSISQTAFERDCIPYGNRHMKRDVVNGEAVDET